MLSFDDHKQMMRGFTEAGFTCLQEPSVVSNPIRLEWQFEGQVRRYRLWAFDITHGGGGPTVRAADEFRIQITNGPAALADIDTGGVTDLLVGYSRDRDAIVAYDRRWLTAWTQKKQNTGSGGSPSVQVKEADIQAGHDEGIHHLVKNAGFGQANIVTLSPLWLPAYLANHNSVLGGTMSASDAQAAMPQPPGSTVVDYCRDEGFPFEPDLLARYIAAMLTKPLVILAGISGTGKSKLAELVAEFYSRATGPNNAPATPATGDSFVFVSSYGEPDPTRFALVAVRPDWIDNQSILGFVNPITNQYESTQALDLILRAHTALEGSSDKAAAPRYFMLLDEMNLARVEHYFSDWLACTESRRYRHDLTVQQQPIPLHRMSDNLVTIAHRPDGSAETLDVPSSLPMPTNLVVTGTVNVDETTYGFSPKVLDRAMVLEFDEVDLQRLRNQGSDIAVGGYSFPEILAPFRLATSGDYAQLPTATHEHIVALNGILESARLHLGYRAANEMALFMTIYNGMLPSDPNDAAWERALDVAVLQKVLPRLSGNRAKLENPLARLCFYLRDRVVPSPDSNLEEFDPEETAVFPKAYRRAVDMLSSLRDFGFVSFFK